VLALALVVAEDDSRRWWQAILPPMQAAERMQNRTPIRPCC